MRMKYLFKTGFLLLSLSLFVACSDDDAVIEQPEEEQTYETEVHITDSPIDNAEIEGVFVTITGVSINGQPIEGFGKTTLDISSLNRGATELLGTLDLEAGTTSDINLSLDHETDDADQGPGSYVLVNGEKRALVTESSTINLTDQVDIQESAENKVILDFDLRKAILADENGAYSFIADNTLASSIRAVNALDTGTITGTVSDSGSSNSEAVVVYAYKAGAFEESEATADSDGRFFANAVNSSRVDANNGNFQLNFIEAGDYELHFVSYADNDADGQLDFQGEIEASGGADLDLNNISVGTGADVNVDVTLAGLIGF